MRNRPGFAVRRGSRTLVLLLLGCFTATLGWSDRPIGSIREITIETSWGGLFKSESGKFTFRQKGGRLARNGEVVPDAVVAALLAAVQAPAITQPELSNLGVTPEWLRKNAGVIEPKYGRYVYSAGSPNQKDLYRTTFSNAGAANRALGRVFGFARTDDYPLVSIVIRFLDGSDWRVVSHSQYDFMIPWEVQTSGDKRTTFNADISRAVAALLPKKATNRDRISGSDFPSDFADAIMSQIEAQWGRLDAENRAGYAIRALSREFSIVRTEINPYHNVDYGRAWNKGPQETNLHATLKPNSPTLPVSIDAILLYSGGAVHGYEDLPSRIAGYETLVSSLPWLTEYLRSHPKVIASIMYVHDRSLSPKAFDIFAADMATLGKRELADEVRPVQDRVALLNIGYGARWLALPDGRMILWRYAWDKGFLKWNRADFRTADCTDYRELGGGCVGAVVQPDGTLVKEP